MELLFKPQDIAIPIFALTIAIEAWYDWRKRSEKYSRRDMWTNIALGFVSAAFGALFGIILTFFYTLFYDLAPYKMPMTTWWPWLILVLGDDFAYYWFHRMSHESRLLWNLHVVHHSSEHFNLSVAVRQSWFGNLLNWVFYIPLGFAGFPLWAFVTVHGFNLIYQYWIHTPFVKTLGPLEYVLNTPSHHRVHHAVNPIYLDKNYAGVFIVWDRMFGSFQQETEEPRYGIIKPIKSFNWVWINTHAWVEMWEAMKERKTLFGKLRCIFASPNMDFIEK
ncbi:MAG TPA: sterol desaturase family protein [Pyrinomonadaceae bacterium]|jgi:sterol desaturase/sphingolipid hydroxylase (fatty acid hydroxylase superfamily)|nr:sterol desaturase family protein [Pyrinomonadaceae bacterium]